MKNITPKNNQFTSEISMENSFNNDVFSRQETDYPSIEMLDSQGLMKPQYGTNKKSTLE